jgi:hypothetical protein
MKRFGIMKQMKTGQNISQRDLILIPFPFSGSNLIFEIID